MFSSIAGRLAYTGLCSVVLEEWIMLHLLMCSSFIGLVIWLFLYSSYNEWVDYGLCSVVL